ncbi:MAG: hypothetical protein ACR2NB_14160 [Solirubrobacteraceae bacterium]
MAAGVVYIPWYATLFRSDRLAEALEEIAPVALRYRATDYSVYRSRDDQYRILHFVTFEDKLDWERYWGGPEFIDWRAAHTSWYQVPVLYVWHDLIAAGHSEVGGEAVVRER